MMVFAEIDLSIWGYVIAFCVIFFAQIYGAVASSDGIIIQPVLIGLGIPANVAIANDATGSMFGGFSAAWVYHKKGLMPYKSMLWWVPGIVLGPIAGVFLLISLPLFVLELIVACVAIGASCYFLLKKKKVSKTIEEGSTDRRCNKFLSCISGFIVGFLSGFGIGGVGVVVRMLLMTSGLDVKRAIAAAQIIGTAPMIPAFIGYLVTGLIAPLFLFIISIAFITGSYLGSHMVVKMNPVLIEKIFMVSTIGVSVFVLINIF